MPHWVVLVLLAMNLLALALYGFDKRRARVRGRRLPEAWLLWPIAFGGAIGAWAGMSLFRHKTRKLSFRLKAVLATLVNGLWLWWWWKS